MPDKIVCVQIIIQSAETQAVADVFRPVMDI